jgi:hypothetical protein
MNRKHNPMVALVALLLLAVLLLLVGCSAPAAAEEPESSPRFIIENCENDSGTYGTPFRTYIITDTATGGQYLFAQHGSLSGVTVLQPAPEEVTTS